jgi:hypothetical protein
MTAGLTLGLFLLTVAMCVISAIAAIVQVTRIDPVTVFKIEARTSQSRLEVRPNWGRSIISILAPRTT